MTKLLKYALFAIMALVFSACSSVNHNLVLGFDTNPKGAQIACDEINMVDSIKMALQTGILRIAKCKAVFISGYEQSFKDSINIDKQDLKTLFIQTINRPNTAGYDKDMQYALEVEKKEILEANEMARTLAAQEQAWAAQQQAWAAQRQANAARDQANAVRDQTNAVKQWINKPTMCNTFGSITTCY